MFTGIVECVGEIIDIVKDKSNVHITISSDISSQLKIDQSVAHDGICLTVIKTDGNNHTVTAIDETLNKTCLGDWIIGQSVNLERCMTLGGRLDGHIVQGHVDCTATCIYIKESNGSWEFRFKYPSEFDGLIISKGSITVNGTSLTVVNPSEGEFSVFIIPYTYHNTKFNQIKVGSLSNLEFDILGKYILKNLTLHKA